MLVAADSLTELLMVSTSEIVDLDRNARFPTSPWPIG